MLQFFEPGIGDSRDVAREFFKNVETGQIGIRECGFCEPAKDLATAGRHGACGQDHPGDIIGRLTVAQEKHALVRKHGIENQHDWVGVGAV